MKVTVIPIAIRALCKIPKGLIKGLEDMEIRGQQTLELYNDHSKYWEESWRLEGIGCHIRFSEKPPPNASVKKVQRRK